MARVVKVIPCPFLALSAQAQASHNIICFGTMHLAIPLSLQSTRHSARLAQSYACVIILQIVHLLQKSQYPLSRSSLRSGFRPFETVLTWLEPQDLYWKAGTRGRGQVTSGFDSAYSRDSGEDRLDRELCATDACWGVPEKSNFP